jgi:hypothetical protein
MVEGWSKPTAFSESKQQCGCSGAPLRYRELRDGVAGRARLHNTSKTQSQKEMPELEAGVSAAQPAQGSILIQ